MNKRKINTLDIAAITVTTAVLLFFLFQTNVESFLRTAAAETDKYLAEQLKDTDDQLGTALLKPAVSPQDVADKTKPPQFVLLAFDGSRSLNMWEETRAFARDLTAKGAPIRFTYFINAIYFLTSQTVVAYKGPHHERGQSAIGYGDSYADIAARVAEVNAAAAEGNEIGSHTVAHWNGGKWTEEDWQNEFDQFKKIMFNLSTYNPGLPADVKLAIEPRDIVGFRAPELAHDLALYPVLAKNNFRYDTSKIDAENRWPKKNQYGVWEFPLASIQIGPKKKWTISMDYSIFVQQTHAQSTVQKDSPVWKQLYRDLFDAYMSYFNNNYKGNRAPIYIGHHFSTWNGSLYWNVMKDLASAVCGLPQVRCTTLNQLADYMDSLSPQTIEQYQKGQF